MLKNDEIFWQPTADANAPYLSWGNSRGDFALLFEHSRTRWQKIVEGLDRAGIPRPSGNIVEFGAGMGLLDDLIEDPEARLTLLDHTSDYIAQRDRPLSQRARHVLWTERNLTALQAGPSDYDWLISVGVFYHIDLTSAAALIFQLGRLLRPGGRVLLEGFMPMTPEWVREEATRQRLFLRYPTYPIDVDALSQVLAPEYEELSRKHFLLFRKR
jgi:SAM-dependent methyltransferase